MLCKRESEFSWRSHSLSCIFILTLVLLLAIFVPDIRNVFGVVGECLSILLAYCMCLTVKFTAQQLNGYVYVVCVCLHTFSCVIPGSTTSTCLLFVYPGMFYLRISSEPIRSLNSAGVSKVLHTFSTTCMSCFALDC